MSQSSPFAGRAWILVLLLAVGVTVWGTSQRIQRMDHAAVLTRGESIPSAASPTGYAGGIRERVLPDHDNHSYEWIAQSQRMLATGEWRIRHIPDENAPFGRETHVASPYRWWLALVAWFDSHMSDRSIGLSVERAALYADPVLHLLVLVGITLFAARYAGALAASLAAIGGAFLFPFAARFFPGVPDDSTLEAVCGVGSLLPLLAGVQALNGSTRPRAPFWFAVAGIFGGVGMWVSPASQVPLTLGIALGALAFLWVARSASTPEAIQLPALWRMWSLAGAVTVLVASLLEFYPAYLGTWELRAVHPLYGLAWLGLGELLAGRTGWAVKGSATGTPAWLVIKLVAAVAFLAVPVLMYKTGNAGFLVVDELFYRLTNQPGGVMASNFPGWIREGGSSSALCAAVLPITLLLPAVFLLIRRGTVTVLRGQLALAIGPVLLASVLAWLRIRQWLLLDSTLLVLLVVTTHALCAMTTQAVRRWIWSVAVVLVLLPGVFQIVPLRNSEADNALALPQVVGVVERDLAHWLAKHTADGTPPLVLAPPKLTTTLNYYGGLRGVSTLSWENEEGLAFGIRIAVSTSPGETVALLRQRGVTHIVMPSWDPFFDSYIESASVQVGELFYRGLSRWSLPPWLKAVPYQLPSIPGFEKHSVKIFEVVDEQEPAVAAARLTEYFVEMGLLETAKASHQALLKYPADFGVQVARAQLWATVGDAEKFTAVFEPIISRLTAGADRYMPWDRRVSLAIVLARGNRLDLARPQVQRCMAELTELRLRSLTTNSLYRLLLMNKALGIGITDSKLRDLALDLLPAELRQTL